MPFQKKYDLLYFQELPCAFANVTKGRTNRLIWHSPKGIRSKLEQFVACTALMRLQGTLPCHVAAAFRQNADVPHPYDQSEFLDQLSANTTKYNATFEGYSS